MKRILSLTAAAAVTFAFSASAQVFNQPVYVNPAAGGGLGLYFDYGKGANDESLKYTGVGGRATLGVSMLHITAGASSVNLSPESKIGFGANVAASLINLSMVTIAPFAGFGTLSLGGTDNSIQNYPVGAAIGVGVPMAPLSIWAAPRVDISTLKAGGTSNTETNFGVSGGVDVTLPMGIGAHAAIDYVAVSGGGPVIWGIGAHYIFSLPGM